MAERPDPAAEEVPAAGDGAVPDDDRPGADMGVAYDRAIAEDEAVDVGDETDPGRAPGIREVYRSGS